MFTNSKYITNTFLVFILFIYSFAFFTYSNWNSGAIIRGGDPMGYHLYLPSVFIYNDIGTLQQTSAALFAYKSYTKNNSNKAGINECIESPTGKPVIKYTLGVAMLQAPFFIAAHTLSPLFGYRSDGFSDIYLLFNGLSVLLYTIAGLYMLLQSLSVFFRYSIALFTVLCVSLGTNLYMFQIAKGAMAHPYLFYLYSLLLYATILVHQTNKPKYLLLAALAAGWITCIRPTEIIVIIIPLLYGIYSLSSLFEKMFWIKNLGWWIVLAVFVFLIPIVPQLFYWKFVSGQWLFYSYGNESFDFKHPHIYEGLLGFKNGWLSYTPIMLFALLGYVSLYKRVRKLFWPLVLFLPVHIYIIYSWWCWQYVNGFGSRPMVETYAFLAVPFAAFAEQTFRKWYAGVVFSIACLFLIWLNIFQTHQSALNILWSEAANKTYVFNIFGKTKISRNNLIEFDTGETQPQKVESHTLLFSRQVDSGQRSLGTAAFLEFYSDSLTALKISGGDWLKVGAVCCNYEYLNSIYEQSLIVVEINGLSSENKHWKAIKIQNKLGNKDNEIWSLEMNVCDTLYFYTRIPDNCMPSDQIKIYAWNMKGPPVIIKSAWAEKAIVKQNRWNKLF